MATPCKATACSSCQQTLCARTKEASLRDQDAAQRSNDRQADDRTMMSTGSGSAFLFTVLSV
jgi:hypothetical protein